MGFASFNESYLIMILKKSPNNDIIEKKVQRFRVQKLSLYLTNLNEEPLNL